jgi:hypothetical protein
MREAFSINFCGEKQFKPRFQINFKKGTIVIQMKKLRDENKKKLGSCSYV